MRNSVLLPLFFMLCLSWQVLLADSPLTSTDFWKAFQDVEMVRVAQEKGEVDQNIAHFLARKDVPLDHKMAVCNALGWDFNGKKNHLLLLERWGIKPHPKKGLQPKRLKKLDAELQLCVAYLMALDNYFEPDQALPFIEQAAKSLKKSYTAQMIRALVRAQIAFENDWCQVWREAEWVEKDSDLRRDLRQKAVDIILEYMQLYQGDCK